LRRDHEAARPHQPHRHDRRHGDARQRHRRRHAPARDRARKRQGRPGPGPRRLRVLVEMRRLSYYFNETINSLRRQGLMVFAAVSTVFISLFLFGGALLIGKEVNLILDYTTEKVQVAVFLQDSISNADRERLYNMLAQMPEVGSVRYESKQEAYQRFKQIFKSEPAITQNVTAQAI